MEGGSHSSRKVLETLSVASAVELTEQHWWRNAVSDPQARCWSLWSETSSRTDATASPVLAVWAPDAAYCWATTSLISYVVTEISKRGTFRKVSLLGKRSSLNKLYDNEDWAVAMLFCHFNPHPVWVSTVTHAFVASGQGRNQNWKMERVVDPGMLCCKIHLLLQPRSEGSLFSTQQLCKGYYCWAKSLVQDLIANIFLCIRYTYTAMCTHG